MKQRVWGFAKSSGPGLLAQLLTFMAMFMPIVFGLADSLVTIVIASGIASAIVPSATLAVSGRLPSVDDDSTASRFHGASLLALFLVVGLAAILSMTISVIEPKLGQLSILVLVSSALVLGQGIYTICVADLTRSLRLSTIYRTRLAYGSAVFVFTLALCLAHASGPVFVLANALAYLLAPLVVSSGTRSLLRRVRDVWPFLNFKSLVRVLNEGKRLVVAYLLSGLSSQAGSIFTGVLPLSMQGSWAIIMRVSGGLQTIGAQLVSPTIDVATTRARRSADRPGMRRAFHVGAVAGAGLAVVTTLLSVAGVAWSIGTAGLTNVEAWTLLAGLVGYASTTAMLSPLWKLVGLLNAQTARLVWDAFRATGVFGVLLFAPPEHIPSYLGAIGSILCLHYLLLCRWLTGKEPRSGSTRKIR